jgi:hypothetical protein
MPAKQLLLIRGSKPERLNLALYRIKLVSNIAEINTRCLLANPNSSGLETLCKKEVWNLWA